MGGDYLRHGTPSDCTSSVRCSAVPNGKAAEGRSDCTHCTPEMCVGPSGQPSPRQCRTCSGLSRALLLWQSSGLGPLWDWQDVVGGKEAVPPPLSSRQRALFEVLAAYAIYKPVSMLEYLLQVLFLGCPSRESLVPEKQGGLVGGSVIPTGESRVRVQALDATSSCGKRRSAFPVICSLCPRSRQGGGCFSEFLRSTRRMGKLCHFAVLITVKPGQF